MIVDARRVGDGVRAERIRAALGDHVALQIVGQMLRGVERAVDAGDFEFRSVAGIARQTVRNNVTINALLPGPFNTDRLRANIAIGAKTTGKTEEQVAEERRRQNPAGRFGDPAEFGDACAYLCSAQAGFITGQNILLDGGAFPGTL